MSTRLTLPAVLLAISMAGTVRAAFDADKLARVDRPFQASAISLSPDGRYVAYTLRNEDSLNLVIADLQAHKRNDFAIATSAKEVKTFAPFAYLKWATPSRLVFETADGNVIALDPDGGNALLLWQAGDDGVIGKMGILLHTQGRGAVLFHPGEAPTIMPSDPDHPETLFLESRGELGRNGPNRMMMHGSNLYASDVATGELNLMHERFLSKGSYGRGSRPPEYFLYLSGHMLYDRQGNPRVLYSTDSNRFTDRPFYYTAVGEDPWIEEYDTYRRELARPRPSLDDFLGQKGRNEFVVVPDNYFSARSIPLGFDYDPNILYIATDVGRDTYAVDALNLATKERTELLASPAFDLSSDEPEFPNPHLVFDNSRRELAGVRFSALEPTTAWLDPELAAIQDGLDRAFPDEIVEVLQWNTDRSRLLARISKHGQPGRYVIVDGKTGAVDDLLPEAPWLDPSNLSPTVDFAFTTEEGVNLCGYLTLPNKPRTARPPLVVYLQGGLWSRAEPGFNREAQMLADMGVVVLRLNYRGTAGMGLRHLHAIQEGIDTVPLADVRSATDWLGARYPFDSKRIVVMGEGFGGWIALRAIERQPETFRAAVSINAPTSLSDWARSHPADDAGTAPGILDFDSAVREAFVKAARRDSDTASADEKSTRPILVIEGDSEDTTIGSTLLGQLGIGMGGSEVESLLISGDLEHGTPETRKRVFERIDRFFNEHLYDYAADIGDLRVVPDKAAPAEAK